MTAAAAACRRWDWEVAGPPPPDAARPANMRWIGWSEDVWPLLCAADVVVTHGGTGTILKLLTLGKPAVLVPRRAARQEHIDDHQAPVCAEFAARGLVLTREADALTSDDFGWPVPDRAVRPVA